MRARIAAHDAGRGARYTRGRGPVALIVAHRYKDQGSALRIERAIKKLSKTQKMEAAGDARLWASIARRARRPRTKEDLSR